MTEAPRSSRCQCTGQCGHTHGWSAAAPKRACRAPNGCVVVRKKDYPSFWQLAASDTIPLEHAEHYNVAAPVLIEVRLVVLADGTSLGMCQRCKLIIERGPSSGAQ